jgi:hypothetical protein
VDFHIDLSSCFPLQNLASLGMDDYVMVVTIIGMCLFDVFA